MLNGKRISMVAAMAANCVIGAANDIPWTVPGEQRRFRQLTEGHLVVMGRRTYESIGQPLPNRDVLVIGTQSVVATANVTTCRSFQEAADHLANDRRDDVFIAGGETIYRLFLPYADTVHLTEIDLTPPGDTFFPVFPAADFDCIERLRVEGPIPYTLLTYQRIASTSL